MTVLHRALLLGLLALAGWAPPAPQQVNVSALAPAWQQDLAGQIIQLAMSPDGRCVAAATERRPSLLQKNRQAIEPERLVTVFDAAGQRLWMTAVPPPLSFLRSFAVAPGCAWVAVSDYPPNGWSGGDVPPTTVLLLDENGTRQSLQVAGVAESIAISHKGDVLALGLTAREGQPNIQVVTPAGKVVASIDDRLTYRAPVPEFSDDDEHIVVTRFFGVGVLKRSGEPVWGIVEPAKWTGLQHVALWRGIDASRDLKWFAAHYAPMHGSQGGDVALVGADGNVVWRRPHLWEPDAAIAPDGRYVVVQGAPMRGENGEPDDPDVRYWIVDREGRTVAERPIPRALLWFVTGDGKSIVFIERSAGEPFNTDLVVRDPSLNVQSRTSLGRSLPARVWHRDSGLIVVSDGTVLRAYRLAPNGRS